MKKGGQVMTHVCTYVFGLCVIYKIQGAIISIRYNFIKFPKKLSKYFDLFWTVYRHFQSPIILVFFSMIVNKIVFVGSQSLEI